MAKLRRRKKQGSALRRFAFGLFGFALLAELAVSLFVGTLNTSLTMEIQNMDNEISSLRAENEKINIEISSLQNKERVYVIALEEGLEQNQSNIISIQGEN